jgi:hypothetical protein
MQREGSEEVQVGGMVVSFLADLEEASLLSSSGTDRGAALGVLGRQGDGKGVKWESREVLEHAMALYI